MGTTLCFIFFLSGAAALVFENLWFRQAGLAFGNGVWAQSIVLASFMAGLGLGNGLALRLELRLARPVRAYALLELLVAVTGLGLVLVLPGIGRSVAPLLRGFIELPFVLNALRLGLALVLLLVPATAMGLTLPLLTRALSRTGRAFGENLGALYGWNTLGAVAGALLAETVFVPRLGVIGAGFAAASLNVIACLLAFRLSRTTESSPPAPAEARPEGGESRALRDRDALRILAAAFLAGMVLLALEVVWFRFLALYTDLTSLTFSLLLGMVLAGIGLGGVTAAFWLRRQPDAPGWLGALLALAGLLVVVLYTGFGALPPRLGAIRFSDPPRVAAAAAFLTFPVSFVSGVVFTLLGAALHGRVRRDVAAAGALTLANTLGAMTGSLAGGFLLLPRLGMERSFALLAGLYGIAILFLPRALRRPERPAGRLALGMMAVYVGFLLFFPFGLMGSIYLRTPLLLLGTLEADLLAVREGLTSTAAYVELRQQGERHSVRLVTNGFSMSGTNWAARRYMGAYVYLPTALHPGLSRALLICFGVGNTARALVETRELRAIDVVDIAPEVFEMSSLVEPRADPLEDPRVRVHVEDGRNYLALTENRYDLITAEPPPPPLAGVVSLYSQEYFGLVRSRLTEGGFATYWLPVHTLEDTATRAIVRAFCNVFPDCTLWSGHTLDWMLMGTRDARGPVSAERVRRQWEDPRVAALLRDVGLETPELLGASFLADAAGLARLAGDVAPLTDNWPSRIGENPRTVPTPLSRQVLFDHDPREAFARSPEIARLWPQELRASVVSAFSAARVTNELFLSPPKGAAAEARVYEAMARSPSRLPVLFFFGSDPDLQRIARVRADRGVSDAWVSYQLAVGALADRRPQEAVDLARAAKEGGHLQADRLLGYALAEAGGPETVRSR